ncbi:MAG: hypothetical protein ACTSRY_03045 [Alphaproteobacteria bacterium]
MKILWRLSPFLILIGGVIVGAFVLIWAKNIGVSSYEMPATAPFWYPGKEVGFALSPNWLFGLLLMPVLAALAIFIVQRSHQALWAMHRLGMVVDDDFVPLSDAAIARIWRRLALCAAVAAVLVASLSVWFACDQYDDDIGRHFAAGGFIGLASPEDVGGRKIYMPTEVEEYDWSVAALIDAKAGAAAKGIDPDANRRFSLFVYVVYLGLSMAAIFFIAAWMLILVAAASLTLFERPGARLVPSRRSTDPRGGFEALESTFIFILIAMFVTYFSGYLVVVQNLFLRTTYAGWGDLFFEAIVAATGVFADAQKQGLWKSLLAAVGFVAEDRNGGAVAASFDGMLAGMAGMVLLVVSTGFVVVLLRLVASHGKAELEKHLGESLPPLKVWPLRWPAVTDFVLAIFLAAVALFLFRLGALLFLGALMLALYRLWKISRTVANADAGVGNDGGG